MKQLLSTIRDGMPYESTKDNRCRLRSVREQRINVQLAMNEGIIPDLRFP